MNKKNLMIILMSALLLCACGNEVNNNTITPEQESGSEQKANTEESQGDRTEGESDSEVGNSETSTEENSETTTEENTEVNTEVDTEVSTEVNTEVNTEVITEQDAEAPILEDTKDEPTSEEEEVVYTYQELNQTMYAKSSVNVRTLPSVDGDKVGKLSKAQEVQVTGRCNETGWYRISYKDDVAYVSDSYLVNNKPEEEKKEEEPKKEEEKVYSVEDLDGDGYADLGEYTTWNGMTILTYRNKPAFAKFKRDLCYAGLYVPMLYTAADGDQYYYMLLEPMNESDAQDRFHDELAKIGVSSQKTDIFNWTTDGSVIAAYTSSFMFDKEYVVELEETLYNMEFYIKATGEPEVNYWIIIMNGYERDTFPYFRLSYEVKYPGEEYTCVKGGVSASVPDENGEYYLSIKFDVIEPGTYTFSACHFGGTTITEHGFRSISE